MALKLRDVRKSFEGREVLGGIDLDAGDGEVVALLGPSGCGKTSLLRIVAGLARADSGIVERDAGPLSFVFQEPRLLPVLSALDNLRVPLLGALGADEARERAERFLGIIGLSKRSGDRPRKLSGGMRQRLALARGFAYPSSLLLMDEPFQSMDLGLRSSLMDAFIGLWKEEPRSVLFVTHDPDEALYLGDSVCVMGGSPARIVDRFPVPGTRGGRRLMDGALLDTERRVYESLLGEQGIWKRGSGSSTDA